MDKRFWTISLAALLCCGLLAPTANADDFSLLTKGRRGVYDYDPLTGEGSMMVRTGGDRHLKNLADPTICPASASIELRAAGSATTRQETLTERVDLPCEHWIKRGNGYRYRDPAGTAGGITAIKYRRNGFSVRAQSPGYTPIPGPFAFTQVKFDVEDVQYFIRLNGFRENTETRVETFIQSPAGNKAEAAFWDTMWGIEDRAQETIELAEKAGRRRPGDARAFFLAGMIRAFMFAGRVDTYLDAGPEELALLEAMVYNMDIAMPMLWDGTTGDSRGLGFLSGARYELGVLKNDPAIIAQGELEVIEAATDNPIFSTFTPLGTIGPLFDADTPEFQEVVNILDEYFPVATLQCGDQIELCFNNGFGPQNISGSFTFFADTYIKANRLENAATYLGFAINVGIANNWRPEFLIPAQERLANLEARAALYQDDDPSNDPPMLGAGLKTCAWCHYR